MTGVAEYYKRSISLVVQNSKLMNMHLGDPIETALPIRYAEVVVYDSSSRVVQCGLTNADGELKALDGTSDLTIPAIADDYEVRVYSRIKKTLAYAGKPDFDINVVVKKDKYTNELYYLTSTTSSNGVDSSNVVLTAYARQTESAEINGGAFNILNVLYSSYDYIRSNTGTTNTTCLNDKLNVYWKAGFNPFQYYYTEADPSTLGSNSYYDDRDNTLYITGGKLGNINLERTDHFGDYVIAHEFAHHIEKVCGTLATPGGTHAILARIDPRLAWAEGWANYFAGVVMFNDIDILNPDFRTKMSNAGFANTNWTYLFASEGFSDSVQNIGNGSGFMFDLKKDGKNPDSWQGGAYYGIAFDKVDPSKYPGEGHFREGAITRGLFKLSTSCGTSNGGTCIDSVSGTPISFNYFWDSMNAITGMGSGDYPFKSSATFMEILKTQVTSATWNTSYKSFNETTTSEAMHLFSDEVFSTVSGSNIVNRWIPYGTELTTRTFGDCAATSPGYSNIYYIEPRSDDPVLTATNSDQRYSNHYYTLDFNTLSSVDEISVDFTKITPTGTNTEFDLILFQQDYFFNGDYSCSAYDSNGECSAYIPSRTTSSDVVKSDRRSGSISTKTITGLSSLDTSKKYLLNIRAYTPNKSISITTDYLYTITDQTGATLCP